MAKPKGHKSQHGYSVFTEFNGGLGYKDIAEKMTSDGHKIEPVDGTQRPCVGS